MIVKRFPSIKETSGNRENLINYLLFSVLVLFRPKVMQERNPYGHYLCLKRSKKSIVLWPKTGQSPSLDTFGGDQSAGLSNRDDRLSEMTR